MQVIDNNVAYKTEKKNRFIVFQTSNGPEKIQFMPKSQFQLIPHIA